MKKLASQAFDCARSIDPSLALPWAGMSADSNVRYHLSLLVYFKWASVFLVHVFFISYIPLKVVVSLELSFLQYPG